MPVENGAFTWDEDSLYDGILQASTESIRRVRDMRNLNWTNMGALTKDTGVTYISNNNMGNGIVANGGIRRMKDVHWDNGTQTVFFLNSASAQTYDVYKFVPGTRTYAAEGQTFAFSAENQYDMVFFNNKLIVFDGSGTPRSRTSAGTWTATGAPAGSKGGTVYAERLVTWGDTTNPHSFKISDVRDETTFDLSLAVNVTVPGGEPLTNVARLGRFLVAQTRTATVVYFLGTDNPRDWDRVDASNTIGCVTHTSWVGIERGEGDNARAYGFFWSNEGPYLISMFSRGEPTLVPLWEPILRMVRGEDFQGIQGLRIDDYDWVSGVYAPTHNEVRFGCRTYNSTTINNRIIAVDVRSAIAYSDGKVPRPFWRIRDNIYSSTFWPQVLGVIRIDEKTGLPSTTGREWVHMGAKALVYRMDTPDVYYDVGSNILIPIEYRRSGYSGREDNPVFQDMTKSVRRVRLRSTEATGIEVNVMVIADGGVIAGDDNIDLTGNAYLWSSTTWAGGRWGGAEFVNKRGDVYAQGKQFDIVIQDFGALQLDWKLDGYSIDGNMEDRR